MEMFPWIVFLPIFLGIAASVFATRACARTDQQKKKMAAVAFSVLLAVGLIGVVLANYISLREDTTYAPPVAAKSASAPAVVKQPVPRSTPPSISAAESLSAIKTPVDAAPANAPAPNASTPETNTAWLTGADSAYQADHYPSLTTAARSLGYEIADRVYRLIPAQENISEIHLTGEPLNSNPQLVESMTQALTSKISGLKVQLDLETNDASSRPEGGVVRVKLSVHHHRNTRAPWDAGVRETQGILYADALGAHSSFRFSRRYVDKPWIDHFDTFITNYPKNDFILARSSSLASNAHRAQLEAIQDAVRQLEPRFIAYMATRPHEQTAIPYWRMQTRQILTDAVTFAVQSGKNFVVDRFSQTLTFPSTNARHWRHAMLIQANPDEIAMYVKAANARTIEVRETWFSRALGAVALIVILVLMYAFLNAATRGYYALMLKVAAVFGLAVGLLAILFFG